MGNRGPLPASVPFEQLIGKLSIYDVLRHCNRCHGREDGPCEKPYGHGAFACPGCEEDAA